MVANGSWYKRLLASLVMAMLALQLFGLARHHHAIDSHPLDCASCFAGSVPLRLAGSYSFSPAVQPASPVLRSFLISHAHGPPVQSLIVPN